MGETTQEVKPLYYHSHDFLSFSGNNTNDIKLEKVDKNEYFES